MHALATDFSLQTEALTQLLRETEDDHILWLEQQLSLIEKVGLKNYLSEQL